VLEEWRRHSSHRAATRRDPSQIPDAAQRPMRGSTSALRAARARRGINDALLRRVSG
jgi:hypothetical protein